MKIDHPLSEGTPVVYNPPGSRGTKRGVILGVSHSSFGTLYRLRDEQSGDVVETTNTEIVGIRRQK